MPVYSDIEQSAGSDPWTVSPLGQRTSFPVLV